MKRVAGIHELDALARNGKSVVCPWSHAFEKPKPAAFMINLSGFLILKLIRTGMFIYKKEEANVKSGT